MSPLLRKRLRVRQDVPSGLLHYRKPCPAGSSSQAETTATLKTLSGRGACQACLHQLRDLYVTGPETPRTGQVLLEVVDVHPPGTYHQVNPAEEAVRAVLHGARRWTKEDGAVRRHLVEVAGDVGEHLAAYSSLTRGIDRGRYSVHEHPGDGALETAAQLWVDAGSGETYDDVSAAVQAANLLA